MKMKFRMRISLIVMIVICCFETVLGMELGGFGMEVGNGAYEGDYPQGWNESPTYESPSYESPIYDIPSYAPPFYELPPYEVFWENGNGFSKEQIPWEEPGYSGPVYEMNPEEGQDSYEGTAGDWSGSGWEYSTPVETVRPPSGIGGRSDSEPPPLSLIPTPTPVPTPTPFTSAAPVPKTTPILTPAPTFLPAPSAAPFTSAVPIGSDTEFGISGTSALERKNGAIEFVHNKTVERGAYPEVGIRSPGKVWVLSARINGKECARHWRGKVLVFEKQPGADSCKIEVLAAGQKGIIAEMEPWILG